jgi:polysaccharide export outer membrane protein
MDSVISFIGTLRTAAALLALGGLVGCAAGNFRYDRLDQSRDDVELRELEDLVADGGREIAAGRVEYDFTRERDEYKLGRNDVLNIYVMDHPEMSSQRVDLGEISGTTIRKDGFVYLPVMGRVEAAGLTITQFEATVRDRAAQFVVNPQVAVEILDHASQKFFVLGNVRTPGTFPVDGDTTLLEALALAGGADDRGNLDEATVVRAGELLPINLGDLVKRGDVSRNVYMRAGDLVYVPDGSQQKVYVLGEVQQPRVVPIEHGRMTLAEAIAAAGGPTPARARREIAIIRGGYAKPIVYRIDLEEALIIDDRVILRPGDRIVVAPTGLSTASRYMQQILPFLMGAQALGLAAQGATNVAAQAAAAAASTSP